MVYGDISKFAQDAQKIGEKYKFEGLIKWGEQLSKHATDYNIARTEEIFHHFDTLISELDRHSSLPEGPDRYPQRPESMS